MNTIYIYIYIYIYIPCLHKQYLQCDWFDQTSTENFWFQNYIIASYRKSFDALKLARLLGSLEIMSDSVDGQINSKTLLINKKYGPELPKIDKTINAEIASVCKRKVGAIIAEKQPKSFT